MDDPYQITSSQYYLMIGVPGFRDKLLYRYVLGFDSYYFIGTHGEYVDFLSRCSGDPGID